MKKKEIEEILLNCIDEYNKMVPQNKQLKKTLNERLFSRPGYTAESQLDSMGLVNFLVITEEQITLTSKKSISLDLEELLSNKEKYLVSIQSLGAYLIEKLID